MTYKEFLKALAKTPFKWRVSKGFIRAGHGNSCHCPITAVCGVITGKSWNLAAIAIIDELNLRPNIASNIIVAADYRSYRSIYREKVRKDLLRVLNLRE